MSGPELHDRLQELRRRQRPPRRAAPPQPRLPAGGRRPGQPSSARACGCSPQPPPLVDRYPADPGVLVTLLLNHVVLAAGEAMFIDAGVIHAYTSGFGVEIMAASDNVLRAGLTPKHVDIPELLEIANFTPIPPPLWAAPLRHRRGRPRSAGRRVRAGGRARSTARSRSPTTYDRRIVLCLEGEVRVSAGGPRRLAAGDAVFVADTDGRARLAGVGRFAIARTPA